ncbi:MAG: hypothetical protein NTY86_16355 [Deltaproteobacteria bacterium]|nr:hypothetical protein [Deltaproteobacteria bacterium]
MIQKIGRYMMIVMACSLILSMTVGCGTKKEEKAQTAKPVMAPGPAETAAPVAALTAVQPRFPKKRRMTRGLPWRWTGSR